MHGVLHIPDMPPTAPGKRSLQNQILLTLLSLNYRHLICNKLKTLDNPDIFIEKGLEDKINSLLDSNVPNMGHTLGIRFLHFAKDRVSADMPVDNRTRQPFGLLHGGASAALAESLASIGAWLNIDDKKQMAVGIEINANHIRAVREGIVTGTAVPLHRGATTQVWQIKIHNPDNKLVCVSRCTLAIVNKK